MQLTCNNCHKTGHGNYCSHCGEAYQPHRITLRHMLHEATHLITHFDKGFLYTLKQLILRPGDMQKDYIAGVRKNYQKPFSMFFVCGTITALFVYWVNIGLIKFYAADTGSQSHFFQHYFVLVQMALLPLYALANWAIFYKSGGYNYAEFLVLVLYNLSILFLCTIVTNLLRLLFGDFETGYIEMIIILGYSFITNLRFFGGNKWTIMLKTLLIAIISFALARSAELLFIHFFLKE